MFCLPSVYSFCRYCLSFPNTLQFVSFLLLESLLYCSKTFLIWLVFFFLHSENSCSTIAYFGDASTSPLSCLIFSRSRRFFAFAFSSASSIAFKPACRRAAANDQDCSNFPRHSTRQNPSLISRTTRIQAQNCASGPSCEHGCGFAEKCESV